MKNKYICKESNCNNEICYENHRSGQGRCMSCAGKQHSLKMKNNQFAYINGRSVDKHYCIDCRKEIDFRSKRCYSCENKRKYKLGILDNKGKNNGKYGKSPSHGKKTYYNNIYFRSTWEANFAKFLDLSGITWIYEPKRFYFKDCTYLPDFYLPEFNCYIEIKGWWRGKGRKRFNLFKKYFPKINIKLLMQPELKELGAI